MIDLNNLSPPPWEDGIPTNVTTASAITNKEFVKLARSVFDIMIRRNKDHVGVVIEIFKGCLKNHNQRREFVECLMKGDYKDPFTAIVAAEEWIEKVNHEEIRRV